MMMTENHGKTAMTPKVKPTGTMNKKMMTTEIPMTLNRIRNHLSVWWFWYSPPWKKTRRCPECTGIGGKGKRDDWFECGTCKGTGSIKKRRQRK